MDNKSMFKTAIELFLGEPLIEMVQDEDAIGFMTITGNTGSMEINDYSGNWDIWIGEEVVYEVESELVPLMSHTNDRQLFDLYEYAKSLDCDLKYKSRRFVDIVQNSIEKLLINGNLPLTGRSTIGHFEVIYTETRKFLISLN
jgi:hypothetical protein